MYYPQQYPQYQVPQQRPRPLSPAEQVLNQRSQSPPLLQPSLQYYQVPQQQQRYQEKQPRQVRSFIQEHSTSQERRMPKRNEVVYLSNVMDKENISARVPVNQQKLYMMEQPRLSENSSQQNFKVKDTSIKEQMFVLQQENSYLKQRLTTFSEEFKKLRDENQVLVQELRKVEYQRNSLQTNYKQMVLIQEQFQRDLFNQQQRIQQHMIDAQYQEQCKQKLLEHIEQLRVAAAQTSTNSQDQTVIRLQTQVLELEQENHSIRQELSQSNEQLQFVKGQVEQYQAEESNFVQERQLLKQEQEKLLFLSEELLKEATQLKQNEQEQQEEKQQFNEWRNSHGNKSQQEEPKNELNESQQEEASEQPEKESEQPQQIQQIQTLVEPQEQIPEQQEQCEDSEILQQEQPKVENELSNQQSIILKQNAQRSENNQLNADKPNELQNQFEEGDQPQQAEGNQDAN